MRSTGAMIGVLLLSACLAPPHHFVVQGGEEAIAATLTLNGESTPMAGSGTRFTGSRHVADASGSIQIDYSDGRSVTCTIGYITNGEFEPHRYQIKDGRCIELSAP